MHVNHHPLAPSPYAFSSGVLPETLFLFLRVLFLRVLFLRVLLLRAPNSGGAVATTTATFHMRMLLKSVGLGFGNRQERQERPYT
jgi:hypothetical protein